ncbi:MAG: PAS domain S-box protein [Thioalkalivibrio sp.]|nr:MAG: PAS domain S-box protein [Thioalkalivibrio sp.]
MAGAKDHPAGSTRSALPDADLSRLLLENLATGVFGVDLEGRFTFLNRAATRLFGFTSPESVLGRDSHSLTSHADEDGVRYTVMECPIHRAMVTGKPLEVGTDTFRRIDGSPFFARYYATPLLDGAGDVQGAVVAIEDITENLLRERTLTQYKAVFDASRDAILLHDQRAIIDCNPASVELLGAPSSEGLIGRHPATCSPEHQPDGRPSREAAETYAERALSEGSVAYEWLCRDLDGRTFPSEVLLSRVDLPEGPFLQAVVRDITERQRAEKALQRSQAELAAAQEMAHLGNWVWELDSGGLSWSDEVFRIFGLAPESRAPDYDDFLRFLHPEDLERFERAVAAALSDGPGYELEYRILQPDGSQRTVQERGRVIRDDGGRPLRLRGTVQDITDQRRLEDQLRDQRDLVETILDGLPAIFFLLDTEGRLVRWNHNLEDVTGISEERIKGRQIAELVDPLDRERLRSALALTLQEGSAEIEAGLRTHDRRLAPYLFTCNRVHLEGGTFLAGFGVDISERKRLEQELARQASHDRLTGLYNRWKFEEVLDLELERARRYGTQFSVVMFDIDHFKYVNDRFGHDTGDRVLQRIGELVGQQVRRTDILARWGGEEFMLLLSETGLEQARQLAESTRIRVGQADFPESGRLTISLGVTEYRPGETVPEMLKRVDNALYAAKQGGRNRTVSD